MTAPELARVFNAKKVGRNRWIAKCTAHPDKRPSLSITVGRKVPVVLKCMSQGCDTEQILNSAGLDWSAVFDGKPTPEIRKRMSLQAEKENLERQWILYEMLAVTEPSKRRYWMAAARRVLWELFWIRYEISAEDTEREVLRRRNMRSSNSAASTVKLSGPRTTWTAEWWASI